MSRQRAKRPQTILTSLAPRSTRKPVSHTYNSQSPQILLTLSPQRPPTPTSALTRPPGFHLANQPTPHPRQPTQPAPPRPWSNNPRLQLPISRPRRRLHPLRLSKSGSGGSALPPTSAPSLRRPRLLSRRRRGIVGSGSGVLLRWRMAGWRGDFRGERMGGGEVGMEEGEGFLGGGEGGGRCVRFCLRLCLLRDVFFQLNQSTRRSAAVIFLQKQ